MTFLASIPNPQTTLMIATAALAFILTVCGAALATIYQVLPRLIRPNGPIIGTPGLTALPVIGFISSVRLCICFSRAATFSKSSAGSKSQYSGRPICAKSTFCRSKSYFCFTNWRSRKSCRWSAASGVSRIENCSLKEEKCRVFQRVHRNLERCQLQL